MLSADNFKKRIDLIIYPLFSFGLVNLIDKAQFLRYNRNMVRKEVPL
jgi:hypothetical protein